MKRKLSLVITILIPLLALGIMVLQSEYHLRHGKQVIFDITGYDPRHILAGHYLVYNVVYKSEPQCKASNRYQTVYYCVDRQNFSRYLAEQCKVYIRGVCRGSRFVAGIERFYIPEQHAAALDKLVRGNNAQIVVVVSRNGRAEVKDLLIDGKPWTSKVEQATD